ncbi:MAG: TIGR03790 family protein [Verrucomicrobiota bacterium]
MKLRLPLSAAFVLLSGLAWFTCSSPAQQKEFDYRPTTVVIYNGKSPESKELALYYAKKRGIAEDHLVALQTSLEETITRAEYKSTIEDPLHAAFVERGWWKIGTVPKQGTIAVQTSIRVLTLIRGIPLRVSEDGPAPAQGQSNAASVDSELALCGAYDKNITGGLNNPYFDKKERFYQLPITPMFIVGRLDGPDQATARRLVDDALATEAEGLFGRAYIDLAQKTDGGYKQGEEWLTVVAGQCELRGIPTIMDSLASTLPTNYPMTDAALYFGWYTGQADGPFMNPNMKFRRGAVACHIHSFSATTLRNNREYWCGPLLSKGAAAVLGNTWEPYLALCTHLDKFTLRLMMGQNLGEAAWGATPALSWMNIVLGDPLYTPFPVNPASNDKKKDTDYKALRLAMERWRDQGPANDALMKNLKTAGQSLKSGTIYEFMALHSQAGAKLPELAANEWFKLALQTYTSAPDKIRIRLEQADAYRREGSPKKAVKVLNDIISDFPAAPETEAARMQLQQLRPAP